MQYGHNFTFLHSAAADQIFSAEAIFSITE